MFYNTKKQTKELTRMKKFTKIKNISDSRRMPRLSKIRLGAKVQKQGTNVEYPIELPFFLLPPEVAAVHGGKIGDAVDVAKDMGLKNAAALEFIKQNSHRLAIELPVMIPVEDIEYSFPQSYKMYGGSIGLKCIGDGENAEERVGTSNEWKPKACPCNNLKTDQNPKGECSIKAHLSVMLPEVSAGGIFQIDIGSINSIVDINSGIEYIRSLVGRVAMIPLRLRRIPMETHHDGKKQMHYTCQLTFAGNIHAIAEMRESGRILTHNEVLQLEEPDYSDPREDKPDMTYEQPENVKKMIDELHQFAMEKKVLVSEGQAIKEALDNEDDAEIERIYNVVKSRNSGQTQDETAQKLKNQSSKKKESESDQWAKTQSGGQQTDQTQQQNDQAQKKTDQKPAARF